MKRTCVIALCIAALFGISSCTIPSYSEGGYALIYGVANYVELTPLTYTAYDANDMSVYLTSHNFTVLNSGNVEDPTRQDIIDDINQAADVLKEGDLFLFYYSGHGGPVGSFDANEPVGKNGWDEAIFPVDASGTNGLHIVDDELCELISAIPAARKVVIIDACNSGGFIGEQSEVDGNRDGNKSGGFLDAIKAYAFYSPNNPADVPFADAIVLSAAGEDELSFEQVVYQNGVFTEFFLRSAAEGDENNDGYVTVTEAYAYTTRQIDLTFNVFTSEDFLPRISGGPVDFILFNTE